MSDKSDYEALVLSLLGEDKESISFRPRFARMLGSTTAGLFLSQALYWQSIKGVGEWWYKLRDADKDEQGRLIPPSDGSRQSWQWELGITRTEYETARGKLKSLGILEEERRGLPPLVYFRIRMDCLFEALSDFYQENQKTAGSSRTKGKKSPKLGLDIAEAMGESSRLHTENTHEISHENTHRRAHRAAVSFPEIKPEVKAAIDRQVEQGLNAGKITSPTAYRDRLLALAAAGKYKMPSPAKPREGYGGLSRSEIERLARPGETWDEANLRIRRERGKTA